jgi:hypothetical protein
MNKKPIRRAQHLEWIRKELAERKFSEEEISGILDDASVVPEIAKCEVLIAAWNAIFSFQQAPGWLEATVKSRNGQQLQFGQRPLDFYDETSPMYERLTAAIERVQGADIDEGDLLLMMREAQKHAVANLLRYLDGGTGSASHLYEQIYEDGDFRPGRSFCDLEGDFLRFDPEVECYGSQS